MAKKGDKRIHEAQGRKSRQTAKLHQLDVLIAVMHKPSTFSQLLKKTGFSKPVLTKHLKFWINGEMIYKDTIKRTESTNSNDVGKIVYRAIPTSAIPSITAAMETALQLPNPWWEEESIAKLRKHLEEIAIIILDEYNRTEEQQRITQPTTDVPPKADPHLPVTHSQKTQKKT
jgi:hypothetical protein